MFVLIAICQLFWVWFCIFFLSLRFHCLVILRLSIVLCLDSVFFMCISTIDFWFVVAVSFWYRILSIWASLVVQKLKRLLQCRRPGFDPWVRKIPWRRKWQPTPVYLPGESHGWRSLVGYSPWGRKGSDTTERLHFHFSLYICIIILSCWSINIKCISNILHLYSSLTNISLNIIFVCEWFPTFVYVCLY